MAQSVRYALSAMLHAEYLEDFMGDIRGFLKVNRAYTPYRAVCERVKDYGEVFTLRTNMQSQEQADSSLQGEKNRMHP
jgi:hypothetical protein